MALRINLRKIRPGYILKPRGKNLKFVYYVRCGLRHFVPSFWLRRHKAELLATLDARTDKEQILDRVNYYPKSRSKRSRYSSENDVLIEKSVKYTDFFLLSIVYA